MEIAGEPEAGATIVPHMPAAYCVPLSCSIAHRWRRRPPSSLSRQRMDSAADGEDGVCSCGPSVLTERVRVNR
jgi:hypothetical protein